jgi:Glycosyl hydrolase family 12
VSLHAVTLVAVVIAMVGALTLFSPSASAIAAPKTASKTAKPAVVFNHPCKNPNYTSSSGSGGVTYGADVVTQDVWDPISITQTLYACAGNSFYVKATVGNSGGAVQSYPSVYVNTPDLKVSAYKTLTSNFDCQSPPKGPGLDYECAYDEWFGNDDEWTDPGTHTEMMIWLYNDGQTPAGSIVDSDVSLDGTLWTVWNAGNLTGSDGDLVTFVRDTNTTIGTTDQLDFFNYAAAQGWLLNGTGAHVWQIDLGYELCATPAAGAKFAIGAFNLIATT